STHENIKVNKRDRSKENFIKRWSTLKKNGLEVHQGYDAAGHKDLLLTECNRVKLSIAGAGDSCRCCA
ncbi:hypothetical protein BGZ61DRAFT_375200, partial [Ilyonectria robusta]|uniref:uncharacterized protein n=1 Tax=Ilyonectria robusta TaxID=1079257 RepID=UPI001E8DC70D